MTSPEMHWLSGSPFKGHRLRALGVFHQRVDIYVTTNKREAYRRSAFDLGPIEDADLLRVLMGLPEGVPVPLVQLHPLEQLVLQGAVRGVVERRNGAVIRRVVPAVGLVGIVKHAASWDDVQSVSLLRTHAPRLVVTSPALARRVLREGDAEIGVAISGEGQLLRDPGRRWVRPSWQRWLVAERAFARMLAMA